MPPLAMPVRRWLFAIWICFLARGAFYAAAFPVWEGFDEWAHFAVIQRVALRGELLVERHSPVSRQVEASLQLAPVPWELRAWRLPFVTQDNYWRLPAQARSGREMQFHAIPSAQARENAPSGPVAYEALQPPFYYWLAAPLVRAMANTDLGTQILWLRWLGVLIASFVCPLSFLVGRAALGSDSLGLGCAAIVAAMPEFAIDVARIANDCVAVALFTLLTWLLVESVQREFRYRQALWIGVVLGLGLLSKAYFLTAVPAVAFILLDRFRRGPRQRMRAFWNAIVVALSSFALAGWWYIRNLRTTGTLSGLSEAVDLRGLSPLTMLRRAGEIPWPRAIDGILLSHLWFGGWSSLTIRSWMYHLFYLLILLAAIGLIRLLHQPPIAVLATLYASFWAGQLYNALLLYLSKGIAVSMGWYLMAVVAAEVALAIAGLSALAPRRVRRLIPAMGVTLFALLDLYTIHAVAVPYYSGLIAHRANGALAAVHLTDFGSIGMAGIAARLIVYKTGVLTVSGLEALWAAYLIASVALVFICMFASHTDRGASRVPDKI